MFTTPVGWLVTCVLEGGYAVLAMGMVLYVRRRTGLPLLALGLNAPGCSAYIDISSVAASLGGLGAGDVHLVHAVGVRGVGVDSLLISGCGRHGRRRAGASRPLAAGQPTAGSPGFPSLPSQRPP